MVNPPLSKSKYNEIINYLKGNPGFNAFGEALKHTAKHFGVSENAFSEVFNNFKIESNENSATFQFQNKEQFSNCFSDDIYNDLPELLKHPCQQLTDQKEKEVFLVAALGVISGLLPNVQGRYGGREYGPNLYIYLIGAYGEGKGVSTYAKILADSIHQAKLEKSKELTKDYGRQLAQYKKNVKLFEQNKIQELPEEPVPPPHCKLFIPANIGKSGIIQLLSENKGKAIIFETEADTLAEAFKQEHGGFSDVLRQSFGHENISLFRRTGNEDIEIANPCLSVVLTSTFDQLLKLIPTIENGLFSRFLFYWLEASPKFNNVFDKQKNGYTQYFKDMGKNFKKLYDYFESLKFPVSFELQSHQEARFVEVFQEQKSELLDLVSPSMGGTVNRLGLICFRIAMQFSVLRNFEKGKMDFTITCTDQDFENALRVVHNLKKHAIEVYWKLPKPKPFNVDLDNGPDKDLQKSAQKRRCRELYQQGIKNYREISKMVLGTEKHQSKVYRWIHET